MFAKYRRVASAIELALADTPVVALNGARQAGKTTLCGHLNYPGRTAFVTLDDVAARAAANDDPVAFLSREVDTLVIDEAQLAPPLFRALKAEVDRDRRPGRFLLTGSARLLHATDMADALVGRVESVELWPFSQDELEGTESRFIEYLVDQPSKLMRSGSLTRDELVERICVGGYPESVARNAARRTKWFQSYVATSVTKVVRELADIERLAELPKLLGLCAARTGTELNASNIAADFGIPARSISAYLARLASAFFIQLVPAWSTNLSAKVVRKPKMHMIDSGLAAHLTGASPKTLQDAGPLLGQLLETFVVTEIAKQITWAPVTPTLSHFRDRGGAEVDIVLEFPDGRVACIEVKATRTPKSEDFAGIRFFAERLQRRFAYGILLTASPTAIPFGPNMAALPIETIWRAG
jgi:uncharacterized protein